MAIRNLLHSRIANKSLSIENRILSYLNRLPDEAIEKICELPKESIMFLIENDTLNFKLKKKLADELERAYREENPVIVIFKEKKTRKNKKPKQLKSKPTHLESKKSQISTIESNSKNIIKTKDLSHNKQNETSKDYLVYQAKLKEDFKTSEKLKLLFLLPDILNTLLTDSKKNLNSISDAKLYLLTKLQELTAFSLLMDKNFLVSQIDAFLKYWLKAKRVPNRFSFHSNCSIKKDCSAVFIDQLGLFSIDDANLLKYKIEYKWIKYHKRFDLVRNNRGFYVEIPYELKIKNFEDSRVISEKQYNNFGQGMEIANINIAQEKDILKSFNEYLVFLDKVNKAYSKTAFKNLEETGKTAWSVSGGLPSLGKRR